MSESQSPQVKPTHIVTGPVRLSFPALFKPRPKAPSKPDETKPPELTYQASILIPPTADLKPYLGALHAAMIAKWDKAIPISTASRQWPIHKAEEKAYSGYSPGWHYISMHSKTQPKLFDQRMQVVLDENMFYPGCWVRAHINAFAWANAVGGKGLSFGLLGMQFLEAGERFDGRVDSAAMFGPVEVKEADANAKADAPAKAASPFDMLDLPQ